MIVYERLESIPSSSLPLSSGVASSCGTSLVEADVLSLSHDLQLWPNSQRRWDMMSLHITSHMIKLNILIIPAKSCDRVLYTSSALVGKSIR